MPAKYILSILAVCIPVTGESIPDVECMGKVVELGSQETWQVANADTNMR